ncbi:MAG: hypothetical protein NZ828_11195 [Alphaproteobacteria bacterium]|nr:hypothetical protein [Alphaproteobacteria bacterium]
MKKPSREQVLKIGVPVGVVVAGVFAPVFTICTAMGGALGFGCGAAYTNTSKHTGGAGPIIAATTIGGLIAGATAGLLTAVFNNEVAKLEVQPQQDSSYAYVQQADNIRSIDDIVAQGYKNENGQIVHLTLAA